MKLLVFVDLYNYHIIMCNNLDTCILQIGLSINTALPNNLLLLLFYKRTNLIGVFGQVTWEENTHNTYLE